MICEFCIIAADNNYPEYHEQCLNVGRDTPTHCDCQHKLDAVVLKKEGEEEVTDANL